MPALIVLLALLSQEGGELTKPPQLKRSVEAPYPPAAAAERREGTVILDIDVTATGTVASVRMQQSSGYEDLDQAALEAARQFEFEPAEAGALGRVPVRITYRYRFALPAPLPVPAPVPAARPPVNFSGRIREAGTRDPIAFARVTVAGTSTESDASGRFALRGVPLGEHEVEVRAPFFRKFTAVEEIRPNEALEVLYHLARTARDPYEVVVRDKLAKREVARRSLLFEDLERLPGAQGDPIRVVQNLPGVARTPFGLGLLVVRGAPPQDTGVFLDGHRIPIVFHFGGVGGLTSVINARMLEKIDFLGGGYGPEQGRISAGAVYLTSRFARTDRVHGEAVVDIAGASIFVEGPVTSDPADGAFALALRRSYVDGVLAAVGSLTDSSVSIAPRYYDYQLRYDKPLGSKNRMLTLSCYGSDDELILIGDDLAGALQNTESRTFFHRFNPRFTYRGDDGTRLVISPIAGYDMSYSSVSTSGDPAGNSLGFRLEDATFGVRIDAETPLFSWALLRTGGDLLWFRFSIDSQLPLFTDTRDFPSPLPAEAPATSDKARVPAFLSSIYAELQLDLLPGFSLYPGVRIDLYDFRAEERPATDPIDPRLTEGRTLVGIDPRITARWQIAAPVTVTGQIGRYGQPPDFQQLFFNADLPLLQTTQASAGVEWEILDRLSIDVEGFYRYQSNAPLLSSEVELVDGQLRPIAFEPNGLRRAYGMELLLQLERRWGFFGWIAYTLSKSEFHDEEGEWQSVRYFDQTHNLNMVLSYELPFGFNASARFRYVSGGGLVETTARWYDSDEDAYDREIADVVRRAPAFHQLDLRIDKQFVFETWSLELYLDLQNVYNRRNTEIYATTFDFAGEVAVPSLPIFPLLGVKGVF